MGINEKVKKIQRELENSGNTLFAKLLDDALTRQSQKDFHTIAFMGDDLVGKSTIINAVLQENVLPTTVIPTNAEIVISYGEEEAVTNEHGESVGSSNLTQASEDCKVLNIVKRNQYLGDNALIFKEFHGLLSKVKLCDMNIMSDVYKCDAVVLVMTAEHLLSESECSFIRNYIKYAGSQHLLLVVNKLSAVAMGDVQHVLDYAKSQISKQFSDVKWTIFDQSGKFNEIISKYSDLNLTDEIIKLYGSASEQDEKSVRNVLDYIREQIEKRRNDIEILKDRKDEDISHRKTQMAQQKEFEKAAIEDALIEFQQRKNRIKNEVDQYIKKGFDEISADINDSYSKASIKSVWYEKQFDAVWQNKASSMSNKVDEYTSEAIKKDIDWLNGLFETKLGISHVYVDISDNKFDVNSKNIPYGKYKKYVPIGICGGVCIGYCLFRIVGAVIGLGGGILAYTYLGYKESAQNEELIRKINDKIYEVSIETRKLSQADIDRIYSDILDEFKREAQRIIETKYQFNDNEPDDYSNQIGQLDELLQMIKGV